MTTTSASPRHWGDLAAAILCLVFVAYTLVSVAYTARAHMGSHETSVNESLAAPSHSSSRA
jgi:uncharacterized membrane protein